MSRVGVSMRIEALVKADLRPTERVSSRYLLLVGTT